MFGLRLRRIRAKLSEASPWWRHFQATKVNLPRQFLTLSRHYTLMRTILERLIRILPAASNEFISRANEIYSIMLSFSNTRTALRYPAYLAIGQLLVNAVRPTRTNQRLLKKFELLGVLGVKPLLVPLT